jgi:phosphopantetheinyl transferase
MRRVSKLIQAFYYTGAYTSTVLPEAETLRARLAPARRARDDRQRDTPQRAVSLAAWRLLEMGMKRCGYGQFELADVVHPEDGKPYWSLTIGQSAEERVDFSLSHARGIALCTIASGITIGCDAEERRRIEPRLTQRLTRADAPRLPCWTELESVVKAAGLGIMHGQEIDWLPDHAVLQGTQWWCYPIACGDVHASHVAANAANVCVAINHVLEL